MSFAVLAVVCLAGVLGPVLALPRRWGVPVVVGELLAGVLLGPVGTGTLHAAEPTFAFLANVGFALVMFVAGSHVPIGDPRLTTALPIGLFRALVVASVAVPVALVVATATGTGHAALYAVLLASSSAAVVLPVLDASGLRGLPVLQLLPQVALADAACIVAVPLVIDPARAGRAALGAVTVIAAAAVLYVALRFAETRGWRHRMHRVSERRKLALELRTNLTILFALAAVAQLGHVSVMLAGFAFGLVVAAIGEPRRLARQLFAVTEGFLGPVFFVWLGASLDLRALARRPELVVLGVVLGLGAVLVHAIARLLGQPLALGVVAAAQLGVPVAAATLGTQTGALAAGVPAALMLGALLTLAATSVGAAVAARSRWAVGAHTTGRETGATKGADPDIGSGSASP